MGVFYLEASLKHIVLTVFMVLLYGCMPGPYVSQKTKKTPGVSTKAKSCVPRPLVELMGKELKGKTDLTISGMTSQLGNLLLNWLQSSFPHKIINSYPCLKKLISGKHPFLFISGKRGDSLLHIGGITKSDISCLFLPKNRNKSLVGFYDTSSGVLIKTGKENGILKNSSFSCEKGIVKTKGMDFLQVSGSFRNYKVHIKLKDSNKNQILIGITSPSHEKANRLNTFIWEFLIQFGKTRLLKTHLSSLFRIPTGNQQNIIWNIEKPTAQLLGKASVGYLTSLFAPPTSVNISQTKEPPLLKIVSEKLLKPGAASLNTVVWGDPSLFVSLKLLASLYGSDLDLKSCMDGITTLKYFHILTHKNGWSLLLKGKDAKVVMKNCIKRFSLGFDQFSYPGKLGKVEYKTPTESFLTISDTIEGKNHGLRESLPFKKGRLSYFQHDKRDHIYLQIAPQLKGYLKINNSSGSKYSYIYDFLQSLQTIIPFEVQINPFLLGFSKKAKQQEMNFTAQSTWHDIGMQLVEIVEVVVQSDLVSDLSGMKGHNKIAKECQVKHSYKACSSLDSHYSRGGEYEQMVAVNRFSCSKGNLKSCNRLGVNYLNGNGITQNTKKAIALFKKGCKPKGSSYSCLNLGNIFAKDPSRFKSALKYYKLYCKRNDQRFCPELGEFYIMKLKEHKKGIALLRKGCSDKHASSCITLADIYSSYFRNYEKSRYYNNVACDLKDSTGCNNLGYIFSKKLNKLELGIKYYRLACDYGNQTGCDNVGHYFKQKKQPKKAAAYFENGCKKGVHLSCYWLGVLHANQKRYLKAETIFKTSCKENSKRSCNELGKLYLWYLKRPALGVKILKGLCNGGYLHSCSPWAEYIISKKHLYAQGMKLFMKMCSKDYSQGCENAALLFANYFQDNTNAAKYHKKACNLGVDKSCAAAAYFYYNYGNKKKSKKILLKACRAGYPIPCIALGKLLKKGNKFKLALKYFKMACKVNGEGCYQGGIVLFHKLNLLKDGVLILKKGCKLKYGSSCHTLGELYTTGSGVKISLKKGKHYFKSACKLGISQSCYMIKSKGKSK
jgi:uncharacterized protein